MSSIASLVFLHLSPTTDVLLSLIVCENCTLLIYQNLLLIDGRVLSSCRHAAALLVRPMQSFFSTTQCFYLLMLMMVCRANVPLQKLGLALSAVQLDAH